MKADIAVRQSTEGTLILKLPAELARLEQNE
jgi:hypothetical protein